MPTSGSAHGAGAILYALRRGHARTRGELADHTGLARATVARRLDQLVEADLVIQDAPAASTGGRPSERFGMNGHAGTLLVADVGATYARVASCDVTGEILTESDGPLDVTMGAQRVLDELASRWDVLLDGDDTLPPVRGVAVSLPGPVDQTSGSVVSPPIMTGWDGYPVRQHLRDEHGCAVWIDNDVNAMALGEHRRARADDDHLLLVKIGTGVGGGLVLNGEVFRGERGGAGDIGHLQMEGIEQRTCRCGLVGCVEAVAGGWALAEQLREQGIDAAGSRDVVALVETGSPVAIELVRAAGQAVGLAVSYAVSLLNPSVVVIGGDVGHAGDHMLSGIRGVVYRRSLALATTDLEISQSVLERRAGVVGLACLVADRLFEPEFVEQWLPTGEWPTTL